MLNCLVLNYHMKLNRTNLFIFISSLALLIVLIIQVNWIFQMAKTKEALFNEKANIVLSKTAEAISADEQACKRLDNCVDDNQVQKIDSMFTHYMTFYNFHMDYSFEVIKPSDAYINRGNANRSSVYNKRLEEEVSKKGLELVLFLPEKKQFIIAEMGPLFITSILLIIIVLILFWRTTRSLIKEKKISERTTEFLNNMTHEFKTPLTNIALAGKMIRKDTTVHQVDKVKHYSGIILEENEKLRLQVEQVLSMTALERGEIPIQKTTLDFHELIRQAVKCISIQVENKKGKLDLQLNADQRTIQGDKTHLTNALSNLIDNAIKYSTEAPEILIETNDTGESLIFTISDKGIGIEKEHQQNVFENFYRIPTGNVHDVKGFGLGLAYVKTIIALHNGTIALHSEKGQGTTFKITLKNG